MQEFRIAVVGAGQTGTPLLRQLLTAPFVTVVGVADLDLTKPGIALAREHGVPVTDDFLTLLTHGAASVDVMIDMTGVPTVRHRLRQHMVATGNYHTLIMQERVALLLMSLSAHQLVTSRHRNLAYT